MDPMNPIPGGVFDGRHSKKDIGAYEKAVRSFDISSMNTIDKLETFPRFATKRSIARFLARQRLFEQILDINGVIVECGVFHGAGLFTWAQLTNIFEPVNYNRKIIGFDTFDGFPEVDALDNAGIQKSNVGDLRGSPLDELNLSIEKSDSERSLSHIQNVELVAGDFNVTGPEYLTRNSHLVVSLLYLDFDLFTPTKNALELFLPRMPKGALVAFDEMNCASFPGETQAFDTVMGIKNHKVQRFPFDPWISYVVLD